MHSGCNKHTFPLRSLLSLISCCNCEIFALIPSQSATERIASDELLRPGMTSQFVNLLCELAVSVWKAISEKNSVIIVLELVLKGQGVVVSMCLTYLFLN